MTISNSVTLLWLENTSNWKDFYIALVERKQTFTIFFYIQLRLTFTQPPWFAGLHWVKLEATKWSITSACSARTMAKTRPSTSATHSKMITAVYDVQSYGTTNAPSAEPPAQFPPPFVTVRKTRMTSTTRTLRPSPSWSPWDPLWANEAHPESLAVHLWTTFLLPRDQDPECPELDEMQLGLARPIRPILCQCTVRFWSFCTGCPNKF